MQFAVMKVIASALTLGLRPSSPSVRRDPAEPISRTPMPSRAEFPAAPTPAAPTSFSCTKRGYRCVRRCPAVRPRAEERGVPLSFSSGDGAAISVRAPMSSRANILRRSALVRNESLQRRHKVIGCSRVAFGDCSACPLLVRILDNNSCGRLQSFLRRCCLALVRLLLLCLVAIPRLLWKLLMFLMFAQPVQGLSDALLVSSANLALRSFVLIAPLCPQNASHLISGPSRASLCCVKRCARLNALSSSIGLC